MSAYIIINIMTGAADDRGAYDEYIEKVKPIVESFGGKYIVRSEKVTHLSPSWKPGRVIVIKFPSKERIFTWLNSPEYKKISGLRENSVDSRAVIVEEPGDE